MTDQLPILGLLVVTNPDLAPDSTELPTITVFQEGDQYHLPEHEAQRFVQLIIQSLSHLEDKHHQAALFAVEVRPGTERNAFFFSVKHAHPEGRRRRRRGQTVRR